MQYKCKVYTSIVVLFLLQTDASSSLRPSLEMEESFRMKGAFIFVVLVQSLLQKFFSLCHKCTFAMSF